MQLNVSYFTVANIFHLFLGYFVPFNQSCHGLMYYHCQQFAFFLLFLGYFVPFSYLNAHAGVYGISERDAAFLNSIIGIANCIGRPICGLIVSYNVLTGVTIMNWCSIFGGTLTICLPFLQVYWALCIYSVLLGFAGGKFSYNRVILIIVK